ncbi:MAG: MgtC/SapB family protein [Anaerovibrio sp.]|uniref:MgtC/SapB family protein n=1 Tax=Anaerovibrio sp. TaxID=1872532 RepID=UPI0025E02636|nr:MgtC/SapB family protein [Anaerovibrio sp.]MCR5177229.1 MgtC/SapB family protein [Anaerovibrio sp.]
MDYYGVVLGRLVISCILGGIIGYERESKSKSAGLRTNVLVCLGSCLIMILSQDLYATVEGKTNADPARLAAQVVSGIGFLGAGAIMKEGLNVTGLTTAACLWVVAGVGLAVGAGNYLGAIATTALVFVILAVLARMDSFLAIDKHLLLKLEITNDQETMNMIYDSLKDLNMKIKSANMKSSDLSEVSNTAALTFELINTHNEKESVILNRLYSVNGVITVEID